MYDNNGYDKKSGEADYTDAWKNVLKGNNQPARNQLDNLTANSTKKGKTKKSLFDILSTPKLKKAIIGAITTITILGTTYGIFDAKTRDAREAIGISKESVSIAMENHGVIAKDEKGKLKIVNLDALSEFKLDTKEDMFLCLLALKETDNYDDMANGYGDYIVKNNVAEHIQYNGADRCISFRQALNIFGYPTETEFYNDMINTLTEQYKNGNLDDFLIETLNSKGGQVK